MDLFDYMRESRMKDEAPLASRLRPRTLDEIVGQKHILGKDRLLYRAIRADKLSSVIFYGPPGTGKTTIARVTVKAIPFFIAMFVALMVITYWAPLSEWIPRVAGLID